MVRYTMEEAKAAFEDLMEHVRAGEVVEVIRAEEVIRVQAVPLRVGAMRGTIQIVGDIVAPLDEPWEVLQ
jgi:hypothetical protein